MCLAYSLHPFWLSATGQFIWNEICDITGWKIEASWNIILQTLSSSAPDLIISVLQAALKHIKWKQQWRNKTTRLGQSQGGQRESKCHSTVFSARPLFICLLVYNIYIPLYFHRLKAANKAANASKTPRHVSSSKLKTSFKSNVQF